jgi:hypothetical protein
MLQSPSIEVHSTRPLPKGKERRLTMRLLNYWQELRGVREFPKLADINPEAIEDVWENCYVLDTSVNASHPVFSYLGKALAKYSGVYLQGQSISVTQHRTLLDQATRHFPDVLETRAPVTSEDEFLRYDGIKIIYRSIILPLSDDQKTITHVLGAANGKEVD